MDINPENYESYFLDYIEGRLSADDEIEIMAFLRNHPGLKEELEQYRELKLDPAETMIPQKDLLKKSLSGDVMITPDTLDEFSIAYLEKDLSDIKRNEFLQYLDSHPEERQRFESYRKTYLKPLREFTYKHKAGLKHFTIMGWHRKAFLPYISAAASIIIIVGMFFMLNQNRALFDRSSMVAQVDSSRTTLGVPIPTQQEPEEVREETIPAIRTTNPSGGNIINAASPVKTNKTPAISIEIASQKGSSIPVQREMLATLPTRKNDIARPQVADLYLKQQKTGPVATTSGDDFYNVKEYAILQFKKNLLEEDPSMINPGKFSVWDLADAGIRGINKMTGWNMALDKEYDQEGDIQALAFNSKTINLTHVPKK